MTEEQTKAYEYLEKECDMIKLKPCPFCGGEAKLTAYKTYIASFTMAEKYYVCCSKNFNHSKQDNPIGFLTKEEAIEAWNRRA